MTGARHFAAAALILFLLTGLSAPGAHAATYYVAKTGDNGNDGSSGTPWLTIQHAVDSVAASDEIRVGAGTYTEDVLVPYSTVNSLVLKGGYNQADWSWAPGDYPSIIQAATATNDVVQLRSTAVNLTGFTLRGGRYGVFCRGGSAVGTYIIQNCIIMNNSSHGIYVAVSGGSKSALRAVNCLIVNNGGDGIYINVDNAGVKSFVYACTIADNTGHGYRDQQNFHYHTELKNCIVSGNGSYGVRRVGGTAHAYTATYVFDSCVYNNSLGNLRGDTADDDLVISGGMISGNPYFVGGGDYRLQASSICIAAGRDLSIDTNVVVNTDLLNNPRSAWDMGCYESGYAPPAKAAETFVDASRPDDSGDGLSWGAAKRWISSGAAMTDAGGIVRVAPGVYNETMLPNANVNIVGAGQNDVKITNIWYTAYFCGTNSTLSGVTLSGGYIRALRLAGRNNTISNVVVAKGSSAGVYVAAHGNKIEQSLVYSNGYGIHVDANVRLTIDRCRVVKNTSHGVYCSSKGALDAFNSLFAENGGVGVYINSDNSSYISTLMYCTLSGNSSNGYSDIQAWHNSTYMTNNIISANGGYGYQRNTTCYRNNNIGYSLVFDNALGDFAGVGIVQQAGMITNLPPLFADTDWNTKKGWRITKESPCRDTAINTGIYIDLAGTVRPQQDGFDRGAYEFVPPGGVTVIMR